MSEGFPHTVLLDTHVWLWLEGGDRRMLESGAMAAIDHARTRGGVIISVISLWEVALLDSKGRINIKQDCQTWIHRALAGSGIILQQLNPEIIVDSTRLPGDFHSDPADRFLVATARALNAPLMTADSRILAYSEKKHVRTIPV
jgi:PIN domain nuclease of toxin-antitoxin system